LKPARGHRSSSRRGRPASHPRPRRGGSHTGAAQSLELAKLRIGLAEAEETLRAIRSGKVDAVVVAGKQGDQVFTLEGAEHAYRVLIESMNEGALTLTADKVILYANACFAKMVKRPLEEIIGNSFRRFLSAEDRGTLRRLLRRPSKSGTKIQVLLKADDGSQVPAQISIRSLAKNGSNRATITMVVTDMTEARRNEELLRALTHRVVRAQEMERGRVALELHDNITQLLCAVHFRSRALADGLPARDGPAKTEAMKLCAMLGQTAGEVERISHNLRPGVLEQLGLLAVLRCSSREFTDRTGVSVKLTSVRLIARLPADIELALFRIFQEALRNVERHAHARKVAVRLRRQGAFVQLGIHDDGIGFDPEHCAARRKGKRGLGLVSMRERATSAGGALTVKSVRLAGTEIEVRIPLA
jgi:two-component system NarL family sensor kinase